MKLQLDEWEVDYTGHTSSKKALYDFYVEEAKQRGYTVAE
jgi:hypothetical protein